MSYDQRIPVIDAVGATWIIMGVLAVALIASIRRGAEREILPPSVSQELKGVAVLAVVFGHIGFSWSMITACGGRYRSRPGSASIFSCFCRVTG